MSLRKCISVAVAVAVANSDCGVGARFLRSNKQQDGTTNNAKPINTAALENQLAATEADTASTVDIEVVTEDQNSATPKRNCRRRCKWLRNGALCMLVLSFFVGTGLGVACRDGLICSVPGEAVYTFDNPPVFVPSCKDDQTCTNSCKSPNFMPFDVPGVWNKNGNEFLGRGCTCSFNYEQAKQSYNRNPCEVQKVLSQDQLLEMYKSKAAAAKCSGPNNECYDKDCPGPQKAYSMTLIDGQEAICACGADYSVTAKSFKAGKAEICGDNGNRNLRNGSNNGKKQLLLVTEQVYNMDRVNPDDDNTERN